MGQRANIVVIEHGAQELYYCHWCASSLPADLFWGPDQAVAFARAQQDARALGPGVPMRRADLSSRTAAEPREPRAQGWLDERWAEGGAVIDLDQKLLLLWGGQELSWTIPLRHVYLQLMQQIWTGWVIRWAHLGILDQADHVRLPRRHVVTKPRDTVLSLVSRINPEKPLTICSILFEDPRSVVFPLFGGVLDFMRAGPDLLTGIQPGHGLELLRIDEEEGWLPQGGFHIDVPRRTVECWAALTHSEDPNSLVEALWPGWQLLWLEDDYQAHLDRLGDRVQWQPRSLDKQLSWVKSIVMNESSAAPTPVTLQAMLAHARKRGYGGEFSPEVRTDQRLQTPADLREQVFERAVAAWKASRGPL
jgi:hypothetical protein